jgi:hypothetical protein
MDTAKLTEISDAVIAERRSKRRATSNAQKEANTQKVFALVAEAESRCFAAAQEGGKFAAIYAIPEHEQRTSQKLLDNEDEVFGVAELLLATVKGSRVSGNTIVLSWD